MDSATGLLINDLLGRFVFTLEGAMAAIENKLDLLGTSGPFAGNRPRWRNPHLLIGAVPPLAIRDWRPAAAGAM